jgi:UDP-N-acetyl-2-amino-2-deoxyglucuronate dehydrogenase
LEGSITILGEHGTVRIGGVAVNEIQVWDFATRHITDEIIQQTNYATTNVYGFGHKLYYENVIQVLQGKAKPHTDGREGLKSLELLIAAYQSAQSDRRVALPLNY